MPDEQLLADDILVLALGRRKAVGAASHPLMLHHHLLVKVKSDIRQGHTISAQDGDAEAPELFRCARYGLHLLCEKVSAGILQPAGLQSG